MIIFSHIPKTAGANLKINIENGLAGKFYLDYDYELLTNKLKEELVGVNIIYGHFISDKYNSLDVKKDLVCFLRNPTERVISNYYYWKYYPIPADKIITIIKKIKDGEMGLSHFANTEYSKTFYKTMFGLNKVSDFSFIGITERFDESINIINEKLGTKFTSQRTNTMDRSKDLDEIKSCYQEIEKANEENYHYYNLALKTFWNE